MINGQRRTIRSIGVNLLLIATMMQAVTPDPYDLASERLLKLCETSQGLAHFWNYTATNAPQSVPQDAPEKEDDAPEETCPPAGVSSLARAQSVFLARLILPAPTEFLAPVLTSPPAIRPALRLGSTPSPGQLLHALCRLTC